MNDVNSPVFVLSNISACLQLDAVIVNNVYKFL